MRVALATGSVGKMDKLYKLTRPSFVAWADRHGYTLEETTDDSERGPKWMKMSFMLRLLPVYDWVIWVDADAYITDDAPDVISEMGDDDWLGYVEAQTKEGSVALCGFMVARSTTIAEQFYSDIWETGQLKSKWADNGTYLYHLGYSINPPVRHERETKYTPGTRILPTVWSAITPLGERGYINQFAGGTIPTKLKYYRKLMEEL